MNRFLIVVLLLCATVPVLRAQSSTGAILGTVHDASGSAIPGAKVTITNQGTNVVRTTVSGSDGLYRVDALTPGQYNVTIEKAGFATETLSSLTLTVAQNVEANVSLKVGSVEEQVTVEADTAPQINLTSSSLGGLVNSQQVADLPLNGRNFIQLALLQPGVANAAGNSPTSLNSTWFSSNGAPIRGNLVTIDGAPMINEKGSSDNAVGTTLGIDGIEEFRVITNSFGAQYGIGMGSQTVISSKGGTNQFHGDVYDYLRNDAMDGEGYFALTHPKLERNDFGGSFGGPIKKDNTFFYAVYEGIRQHQGIVTTINTLPVNCNPNAPGGSALLITNPCAVSSTNPTGAVNPAMAPFLSFYPLPNNGTSVYTSNAASPENVDYGQIRVDHTFSAADSIFGRFTTDEASLQSLVSYTGTLYQNVGSLTTGTDQFDTVAWNHVFSPTLLNTFRVSYSRTIQNTVALSPASMAQVSNLSTVYNQGDGGVTVGSGLGGIGRGGPTERSQNLYSLSDDVNLTKGRHALQFGTLINRIEYYTTNSLYLLGSLTVPNTAALMAGTYTSFSTQAPGSDSEREPRLYTLGFYGQDDFRFNSRLTLNLGMRYEPDTVAQDRHGANWSFRNLTDPAPTYGPIMRNASFKNFEPRVGFAWDVRGNGKTAIRSAFGLYDDVDSYGFTFYTTGPGTPPISADIVYGAGTITSLPLVTAAQALVPGTIPYGAAQHSNGYNDSQARMYQWNFSIEQQITPSMTITLSYVGDRGLHLWDNEEGNPCFPKTVVNGIPNWGTDTGTFAPFTLNGVTQTGVSHICNTVLPSGQPLIATYPGTSTQYVVPTRLNPLWSDWELVTTNADSNYEGAHLVLAKQVSHGLQAQVAYTRSKVIDDAQGLFSQGDCLGPGGIPNQSEQPERRIFNRGAACFDVPQEVQANFIYHLPATRSGGFVGREILSGWWLGNTTTWQTGFPFSPTESGYRSLDENDTTDQGVRAEYVNYGTTTVVPGAVGTDGTTNTTASTFIPYNKQTVIKGTAKQWYNPLMFTTNSIGQLGTVHKAALRGPHYSDVDLSLNKDTKVPFMGERGALEFQAEAFNLFNHTNLAMPGYAVTYAGALTPVGNYSEAPNSTAGQITSIVGNPRQLQLSLKLLF